MGVDKLVIGGGMVFTFLKARGLSVGNSLVEEEFLDLATKLEEKAKAKGVEVILPSDVACGDEFPAGGKEVGFKVVKADAIPDGWLGLDNGPEATEEIKAALADCKTVIGTAPWASSRAHSLPRAPMRSLSALPSSQRRTAQRPSLAAATPCLQ